MFNSILYAYAYRNVLKKPAGPFYYLRALSLGCLDIGDIIARISRLPFAISPQEYALLVTIFLDECIAATAEGYHIATPQMRWSPTIRGTIGPADLWRTFAPGRLPVSFNLTPGPAARQASSEITIQACGEAMPKARGRKAGAPEASAPEVGTPGTGAPKASDPESGTPKGAPKGSP